MTQKKDISEEAYKKLLELKKTDESFSKLILRIINEKEKVNVSAIKEFAGAFEEDSEEWEKIERFLYAERLKGRTEQKVEL